MSTQALTPPQERIWRHIADCILRHGMAPSLRELCDHLGVASTNGMSAHLKALARKGYIDRPELISRGVRLLRWPEVNPADYGEGTHAHTVAALMRGVSE